MIQPFLQYNIVQQQAEAALEVMSIPALSRTTTDKSLSKPLWDTDAEIITTTLSYPRLFCPPDYHQVGKTCYAIAFFQALGELVILRQIFGHNWTTISKEI